MQADLVQIVSYNTESEMDAKVLTVCQQVLEFGHIQHTTDKSKPKQTKEY